MKVRVRGVAAGPRGVVQAGGLLDTTDEGGAHLVATGQGDAIGAPEPERPTRRRGGKRAETATDEANETRGASADG